MRELHLIVPGLAAWRDSPHSEQTPMPGLERLLARGRAKIAQKFGEEAIECLIEATQGNADALVAESADVLYHLLVMWVDAGIQPERVWAELPWQDRPQAGIFPGRKTGGMLPVPCTIGWKK